MRTRAALVAAATLTGVLVAPMPAAGIAATCQGLPATIVANRNVATTTGTEGDDVIVGHDAVHIDALGGNDLICLDSGFVAAGDGNDSVLVTGTDDSSSVGATLGAGDDRYVGGRGPDTIAELEGVSPGSDNISTGAGPDAVTAAYDPASPYHLVLDMGAGEDYLNLSAYLDLGALPSGSSVQAQAGNGLDTLDFRGDSADYFFDLGTGEVTRSGVQTASLTGFEEHLMYLQRGAGLRVLGTPGRDNLSVLAGRIDLQLGDGPDSVSFNGAPQAAPDGAIDLGPGTDELNVGGLRRLVRADLASGYVVLKQTARNQGRMALSGVERFLGFAPRVVVRGGPGAERLTGGGCHIRLSGGDGPDRLVASSHDSPGCSARADGGAGRDRLFGGPADDRLVGGPGMDEARGNAGTDTCRAEREASCEL